VELLEHEPIPTLRTVARAVRHRPRRRYAVGRCRGGGYRQTQDVHQRGLAAPGLSMIATLLPEPHGQVDARMASRKMGPEFIHLRMPCQLQGSAHQRCPSRSGRSVIAVVCQLHHGDRAAAVTVQHPGEGAAPKQTVQANWGTPVPRCGCTR